METKMRDGKMFLLPALNIGVSTVLRGTLALVALTLDLTDGAGSCNQENMLEHV